MSWPALKWAFEQTAGSAGAKLVLLILADFADDAGVAIPGQKAISEVSEQSTRTVRNHIAELVRRQLIDQSPRTRKDGTRTSNSYQLRLEAKSSGSERIQEKSSAGEAGKNQQGHRKISPDSGTSGTLEPLKNDADDETDNEEQPGPGSNDQQHQDLIEEMEQEGKAAWERAERPWLVGLRPIIDGDDFAAWEFKDGSTDQVPWPDRPRILRIALNRQIEQRGKYPLSKTVRYVAGHQYPRSSNDRPEAQTEQRELAEIRQRLPIDLPTHLQIRQNNNIRRAASLFEEAGGNRERYIALLEREVGEPPKPRPVDPRGARSMAAVG